MKRQIIVPCGLKVRGWSVISLAFLLSITFFSCVSPGQIERLATFPLSTESGSGLSYIKTDNVAFPDLYLFIDRSQGPLLFSGITRLLMDKLPEDITHGLSLGPTVDLIRQVLLYKPEGTAELQGIITGFFPTSIVNSLASPSNGYISRNFTLSNGQVIQIYENSVRRIHIALVANGGLAVQLDSEGIEDQNLSTRQFDILVQKGAQLLSDTMIANPAASTSDFGELIHQKYNSSPLVMLLSIGAPANLPVSALRLTVTSELTNNDQAWHPPVPMKLVTLALDFKPKLGTSVKSLKTSIRLALVNSMPSKEMADLFFGMISFSEENGLLTIKTIPMSENRVLLIMEGIVGALKLGGPQ